MMQLLFSLFVDLLKLPFYRNESLNSNSQSGVDWSSEADLGQRQEHWHTFW